jgi:hypothetical protein
MPGYHNHRTSTTWSHKNSLYHNVPDTSVLWRCVQVNTMILNTSTQAMGISVIMVNVHTNYCEQCLVLTTDCRITSTERYACNAGTNLASIPLVSYYDPVRFHNICKLLHKFGKSFLNMYLGFRHERIFSNSWPPKWGKCIRVSNTGSLYPQRKVEEFRMLCSR